MLIHVQAMKYNNFVLFYFLNEGKKKHPKISNRDLHTFKIKLISPTKRTLFCVFLLNICVVTLSHNSENKIIFSYFLHKEKSVQNINFKVITRLI